MGGSVSTSGNGTPVDAGRVIARIASRQADAVIEAETLRILAEDLAADNEQLRRDLADAREQLTGRGSTPPPPVQAMPVTAHPAT